eukprot:UN11714
MKKHNLESQAVEIAGQVMKTDFKSSFAGSSMDLCGADMAHIASKECYKEAGIKASDIDVVELHDCFSATELMVYEGLGLCPKGKGGAYVESGRWKNNGNEGELYFYPKPNNVNDR